MSTTGSERYVRVTLLTFEGGIWISKKVLCREVDGTAGSPTLAAILQTNKTLITQKRNHHEITRKQFEILFPPNGNDTDIDQWDLSLLVKLILILFGPGLPGIEKFQLKEIIRIRNEVVCHAREPSISLAEFNRLWVQLMNIINALASCFDADSIQHASDMIQRLEKGPLDLQSSLEKLAQLCRHDEHMEDVLTSLWRLERRQNQIATGVVSANNKLDDVLAVVKELLRNIERRDEEDCREEIPNSMATSPSLSAYGHPEQHALEQRSPSPGSAGSTGSSGSPRLSLSTSALWSPGLAGPPESRGSPQLSRSSSLPTIQHKTSLPALWSPGLAGPQAPRGSPQLSSSACLQTSQHKTSLPGSHMAHAGRTSDSESEPMKRQKARNVRELFHGRVTEDEATTLLKQSEWDVERTVNTVFNAESKDLAQLLDSKDIGKRIAVVTKDEVLRDLALRNEIGDCVRQFACADCNTVWWRKVPTRKQVSKCRKCTKRYDPVPRHQEWGLAEFECQCGNTFRGTGAMGKAESECYHCHTMCEPARIIPPYRRNWRQTEKPHTYTGNNCYNRRGPQRRGDKCVHPQSNPEKVLVPSVPHVSSGSTVATFLDQGHLDSKFDPSLASISEDEDFDD